MVELWICIQKAAGSCPTPGRLCQEGLTNMPMCGICSTVVIPYHTDKKELLCTVDDDIQSLEEHYTQTCFSGFLLPLCQLF